LTRRKVQGYNYFAEGFSVRSRGVTALLHAQEETMPSQVTEQLRDFHHFLTEKLQDGPIDWSPEEALDEWRRLHPDAQTPDEELAAIQEALIDMANGDRGIPFAEFDRDFRSRHKLPGQP
jgi:hypothetical protein